MNIASIILPCYNPPRHWANNIVEQYLQLQSSISHQVEIILVQDGDSVTVTEADISFLRTNIPHFIFVHYPENQGKGYAIKEGVKKLQVILSSTPILTSPIPTIAFYRYTKPLTATLALLLLV